MGSIVIFESCSEMRWIRNKISNAVCLKAGELKRSFLGGGAVKGLNVLDAGSQQNSTAGPQHKMY